MAATEDDEDAGELGVALREVAGETVAVVVAVGMPSEEWKGKKRGDRTSLILARESQTGAVSARGSAEVRSASLR